MTDSRAPNPPPGTDGGERRLTVILFTALAYWGVAHLGAQLFSALDMLPAPAWLAAAVALAAAVMYGATAAPGIAIGSVLAGWLSLKVSLPVALAMSVMNTVAPIASAIMVRRLARSLPPFSSVADVVSFLLFGVVANAALAAAGGVTAVTLAGQVIPEIAMTSWLRWWIAHAAGTVLFAPMILCWWPTTTRRVQGSHIAEASVVSVVTALATIYVFFSPPDSSRLAGLPYLLFAPLAWVSVRFHPRDVTAIVPLMATIAATGTMLGLGPFHVPGLETPMVSLGLMLLSFSVSALVLAALAEERRAELAERRKSQVAQQRLLQIIEAARDIVSSADTESRVTYMNAAGMELLGLESIEGLRIPDVHPQEAARRVLEDALPTAREQGYWEGENEFLNRDGRRIPVWQVIVAHRGADGSIEHYSTIGRDISARREAEAELRLAASVYHSTIEGIVITEPNGTILSVNPGFSEITGYTAEEAIGKTPRILKSDHHDESFYREMWAELKATGTWKGELWNRRKSGEVFLEHQTITMVPGPDGKPVRYVAVFNDITELRRKDERIRHLAYHDPLTDMPNRQLLQDRLEHALALCRREGKSLAVMFLDLDRFKVINDTLGHDVGDNLLREVARRLAGTVRATDTVARLGGDEFVVVVEQPEGGSGVAALAEKIIHAINTPIDLGAHVVHVTTSIGIGIFPADGHDISTLMKNADTAMYAAKAAGRNAFRFFDANMNEKARWRLEVESELRNAADRGEFELFYQPKIDLVTGSVRGAEALIRWRHPVRGLISPADFIPVAEETGLVVQLGEWAILEACAQIARWRAEGLGDIQVAVNVSTRQLAASGLFAIVAAALEVNNVPTDCLELEVTESGVMTNPETAIAMLQGLRDFGVSLAIDDFGTGYSSLSYLRKLPLSTLKIDRSFVMDVETNEQDAAIVRTILAMADALGLKVVAEGVETENQAAFLASSGCHLAQGFLYARPLPAADFAQWVQSRQPPISCHAALATN